MRAGRRVRAVPVLEVGRAEAARADPGQRMVLELVYSHAPDVVPVRAELEEVARRVSARRRMRERAPLLVEPARVVDAGEENGDEHGHRGEKDPESAEARRSHRARPELDPSGGQRIDE